MEHEFPGSIFKTGIQLPEILVLEIDSDISCAFPIPKRSLNFSQFEERQVSGFAYETNEKQMISAETRFSQIISFSLVL